MLGRQRRGPSRTLRGEILELRIIAYGGVKKLKERERLLKKIEGGDFDVLIITSQFLARRFEILANNKFSFIFVDDVDSLLKNSRNVDRVLVLLGFPKDVVESALRTVDLDGIDRPKGVIMLSSATARPGRRAILSRRLLGFDIGVLREGILRNVEDIEVPEKSKEVLSKIVEEMGGGALVYVPRLELVDEVIDALESVGLRVEGISGSREASIRHLLLVS